MTKTVTKCLLYPFPKKECLTLSLSTQIKAEQLSEKLDGAIKKETECIPKTALTSRAIRKSITKEFEIFEATGEKTANITKITAALESTSIEAKELFQL